MKARCVILVMLVMFLCLCPQLVGGESSFKRGDVNGNGEVEYIIDAIHGLLALFLDGSPPPCLDAADIDDNGVLNLLDAVMLLTWAYSDGDIPPDPGPYECGSDPTDDDLDCKDTDCS